MTHGQKSCHLFCVDEETKEYFKQFIDCDDGEWPTDSRWPEAAELDPPDDDPPDSR